MKKKRSDQTGGAGRLVTADGYTINASPAPGKTNKNCFNRLQHTIYRYKSVNLKCQNIKIEKHF